MEESWSFSDSDVQPRSPHLRHAPLEPAAENVAALASAVKSSGDARHDGDSDGWLRRGCTAPGGKRSFSDVPRWTVECTEQAAGLSGGLDASASSDELKMVCTETDAVVKELPGGEAADSQRLVSTPSKLGALGERMVEMTIASALRDRDQNALPSRAVKAARPKRVRWATSYISG